MAKKQSSKKSSKKDPTSKKPPTKKSERLLKEGDLPDVTVSMIMEREGVLVVRRKVDVQKGTPHEQQRADAVRHLDALVQSMRLGVNDQLNPILVSVNTDEQIAAALDPNNYDWAHICEVNPVFEYIHWDMYSFGFSEWEPS